MGCDCGKIKVREYTKDPDKINKFKDIEELLDKKFRKKYEKKFNFKIR
jgi:hypothetical protein